MASQTDHYLELLKNCLTSSLYDESAWWLVTADDVPRCRLRHPLRSLRALVKRGLLGILRQRSLGIARLQRFDPGQRAEGRDWPLIGYTMVGRYRLDNVQACIQEIIENDVPGDLIETGVWRGGVTIFMRACLKHAGVEDRTVWVADSFAGLPEPAGAADGWDLSSKRFLSVSLEQVQDNFRRFGLLDEQVRFLKGWFHETLPPAPISRLALLRLDGDLYHSTWDTLDALYDRVSPGGFVIVDDYFSWPSCRRAVTDFLDRRKLNVDIRPIDWAGVYWRKPA